MEQNQKVPVNASQTVPTSVNQTKAEADAIKMAIANKRKAAYAKKVEGLHQLIDFCAEFGTDPIKTLARKYQTTAGAPKGRTGSGGSIQTLKALFGDKIGTVVKETEVFEKYGLGRTEMRRYMAVAIKKPSSPETRLWIKADYVERTYTLVKIGKEAPEGWTGINVID